MGKQKERHHLSVVIKAMKANFIWAKRKDLAS